jgi:putative MFS transporter
VTIGRFYVTESANWLHARGAIEQAQRAASRLLVRKPQYPANITLLPHPVLAADSKGRSQGFAALLSRQYRRATIFASVPWFLQDLGTYGIGIFTPTILAATIGGPVEHIRTVADLISDDIVAAKGSALITMLLIVGIVFAVLLADRLGRISLQVIGFLGCAAGLLLASFSFYVTGGTKTMLIFAGFMLFNFMTNLGPNAQTYLLAGEVFPTAIRGKGAGFAAAFGKVGAVTTAFLFPILLASIGTTSLLYILVVTSILGAIITWAFRIETTGVNLDEIGQKESEATQNLSAMASRSAAK